MCDVFKPSHIEIGQDIESFIRYIAEQNRIVFFHNLAFDGTFIIDFLLRHGFTHVHDRARRGEFTSLISNQGKFYSVTVRWRNGKWTEFRDSLKKLPMSVANVAKAFKLKDTKGSIDYEAHRPVGWGITDEERDYIIKDVRIVAEAIRVQIDEGMTKLTVGADSLAQYKSLLGGRYFERTFPVLPETVDADIRRAYRGGFTYVKESVKGQIVGRGSVFDVNSLYPSVMYDRVLPYGEPVWFDSMPKVTDRYPLFVVSITFTAKLKRDHIPCIQIKNSPGFINTVYQTNIDEPVTLSCTNVDLDLWQEQYDLDVLSWNGGWSFGGIEGVFKDYIDYWMNVKETTDGGMRLIAKLHLNSLYGKFATNPDVTGKIPVLRDDVVHLVKGPDETRAPVYTAMGVFITAYARDVTIRAAQAHYARFCYADTDSLHLIDGPDPLGLDVHPTRLGAWKHEADFTRALFAQAKRYTEDVVLPRRRVTRRPSDYTNMPPYTHLVTHIAGLPEGAARQVTFSDYATGRIISGKLVPKHVKGGIVLSDVGFTLKAQP